MKKLSFIAALLCASMISFAQDLVYDTNFALASNGSSASASSGNAALAIDGNEGTRWESAQTDTESWTLNMGQARTFSRIKILWEGAYAKQFTLSCSNDSVNWTNLYTEANLTQAGWQTIEVTQTTAQYIKYQGIERATTYGQSFFEFQVLLPGVSVLTSIQLTAPSKIAKVGEGIALTAKALDQNGAEMEATINYEITPADAGAVTNGNYVPAKVGNASIVAKSGTVASPAIEVFGYEGNNLVLSTNLVNDNKIIAQVAVDPNGSANDAFFAVDGNDGSVWQGSLTNGTADDEASRTYDAWFVADMGAFYSIDLITIHFEGACSQEYHVDFGVDTTNWALGYNYVGAAGINGRTDMLSAAELNNNLKARYVRFWSTKAGTQWGMKVFEFQVFGREWIAPDDDVAPVMVSATLDSKTWNSAVIAVAATDNNEVTKYHVVDATHEIDVRLVPNDGKITVTGLTASTAYNFTITALDAAQNESANNKQVAVTTDAHAVVPTVAAPVPTWPASQVKSIYSDAYEFAPASLSSYNEGWWDNPTLTEETIGGDKYLHYNGRMTGMVGWQFGDISVSTMEYIHVDIWPSDNGTINMGPTSPATPSNAVASVALTVQGGQWNSIDIPVADLLAANPNFTLNDVFQNQFTGYSAQTDFSVDNVYFYRTTPLADDEAPTNVYAAVASADFFSVSLAASATDNLSSISYIVKIGEDTVANGSGASGDTVTVLVKNLLPNTDYNFSVIAVDESGNAAEPVAVVAKTRVTPAPAPTPTLAAEDVKSLFCDAYEPATTVNDFRENWWNGAELIQSKLAEDDNVLFYIPTADGGSHGWAFDTLDATGYTKLHFSIYPLAAGSIRIYPVVVGTTEADYYRTSEALVANEWNDVVCDFAGQALDKVKQLGWNSYYALGSFFIDNVYFYKEAGQGIDAVEDGAKAIKVIENGQLFIIKNGVKYNALGTEVR